MMYNVHISEKLNLLSDEYELDIRDSKIHVDNCIGATDIFKNSYGLHRQFKNFNPKYFIYENIKENFGGE